MHSQPGAERDADSHRLTVKVARNSSDGVFRFDRGYGESATTLIVI